MKLTALTQTFSPQKPAMVLNQCHTSPQLKTTAADTVTLRFGSTLTGAEQQFLSAAQSGNTSNLDRLIRMGTLNINVKDQSGNTALMLAAFHNRPEALQTLIEAKADLNLTNKQGNTALTLAAVQGHTKALQTLIDAKANLNTRNKEGNSAVNLCAYYGQTKTLQVLVDAKADLESKNNNGDTGAILAAEHQHNKALEVLVHGGANMNAANNSRLTPGIWAMLNGNAGTIRLLEATPGVSIPSPGDVPLVYTT